MISIATTSFAPATRKVSRSVKVQAKKGSDVAQPKLKAEQPEFYEEAKVFCNGEEVMTVGGTQKEYIVDIWSGNHPFFLGKNTQMITNDGQVSRFGKKFGDLGTLTQTEQ
ncbi:Ribosomal protein L31 [Ostreococcus tauri]|uniref:50S ribosomal protein L31 n=1 Tax=Ostreococcus tauri TaxID=70448 RepID=Q00VZ3_OSTTA|nr:Ribosomal protein L31 [Ostreococcus tauri]CAL56965.1 Ribosomal protein L31 [Ostreococcus tauri]|eukprot:XP_003083010.1 Ribosomal protein L31 [Ostreococcus tauri]